MSSSPDRLYDLLPVVYRQRDVECGGPLKGVLGVITEQVNAIDQDISQLYDNWFIETCDPWAVPYIGDLIGYQPAMPANLPDDLSTPGERALESVLIPRREVASALSFRLRKGTVAVLEELATALTDWPARAVEFDRHVAVTQALNHLRSYRGRWIPLRSRPALDRLGGAFDDAGRTVQVGRVASHRTQGRYALPNVGLFVWRLKVYALNRVPAYCVEEEGDHCFTFSVLGNDVPLYARSSAGGSSTSTSREPALPGPIDRGAFSEVAQRGHRGRLQASADYYGADKSVAVWAPDWAGFDGKKPIPAERVVPADLSEWHYRPPQGHIAVDPKLGRLAFPPGEFPPAGVWVSYCYGFGNNLGGGPYLRRLSYPADTRLYFVGSGAQYPSIGLALQAWKADAPARSTIEVIDSELYQEQIRVDLAAHQTLEIRAINGKRPVIHLLDWHANRPDALMVSGEAGSEFTIDGVIIRGRAVEVRGSLTRFTLRDSTLVPSWGRESDPKPRRNSEPSLVLVNTAARIRLERAIVGAIRVIRTEAGITPSPCSIEDSIVDATGPEAVALGGDEGRIAGIALTLARSTILGQVHVHAIVLAENSIFNGSVRVARRQQGCMRFCYVPFGSLTPSRYRCQPDVAEEVIAQSLTGERLSAADKSALLAAERRRVEPEFDSTRYGAPGYCRLADRSPREIKRGAEDASEMGVFHDLFEPHRLDMLRARIEDSVPLGVDAGVILVD